MELNHGGDWAGFREKYGKLPLDFSASTTPLPMPGGMRSAVVESLDWVDRYPDPLCRELTAALARKHGVFPEHILCGAGASDLLFRLALAKRPRRALVIHPTFGGYEEALEAVDCETERFFLQKTNGFTLTEECLKRIEPGLELFVLCNPNNPTGRTVDQPLLMKILAQCSSCGALLVLDECFQDFLDVPEVHSLVGEAETYPNLFVLRSFTKWHPLAGLRLGYAICTDVELLGKMRRQGPPWPVSAPAQAAGLAALEQHDYNAALAALIREERPRLAAGLAELGCRVIPGEANFLLFFCSSEGLKPRLEKRGIAIRDCANFPGLGPGWYRAAVRTAEENQALLRAMKEVL